MRKEIIISILIGLGFGLVITYGFYHAQVVSPEEVTKKDQIELATTPTPEATNGKLVIITPEDELVTTDSTLMLSGSTNPGSFVVVFIDDDAQTVNPDEQGKFSVELSLEKGPHVITVHGIDDSGESLSESRTIIVQDPAPTPTQVASDSATVDPTTTVTTSPTPTKKP